MEDIIRYLFIKALKRYCENYNICSHDDLLDAYKYDDLKSLIFGFKYWLKQRMKEIKNGILEDDVLKYMINERPDFMMKSAKSMTVHRIDYKDCAFNFIITIENLTIPIIFNYGSMHTIFMWG